MIEEIAPGTGITAAELVAALKQKSDELDVINSVQEALSKKMDIRAIYELVAEHILRVFNAPSLVIRTFDHSTGTEIWHYSIENGERQYVEPRPIMWANQFLIKNRIPIHIKEFYVDAVTKYGGENVGF